MKFDLPDWAEWLRVPRAPDGLPVRHRVLFGGRGGAKSWTIAVQLVLRARQKPEQILCAREFQNSIRDSSKKLIEDMIERLGFGAKGDGFFSSSTTEIRGRNGSRFIFLGLDGREGAIKSLEGLTLAWVEEAATISQSSIDALIPTIRRPRSEIWWSYNPRFPTDPVDRLFRGEHGPPPGSIVIEVKWQDNPWFPAVLRIDMEYDRIRDPDKYAHIWLGQYLVRHDAQVFHNWSTAPFETPVSAALLFGCDWGYSRDPTVLIRCFVGRWEGQVGASNVIADPEGGCLFIDYERYEIGCPIDDTPALFAGNDTTSASPRWQNRRFCPGIAGALKGPITADSSRPEMVDYMRSLGFNIRSARKGPGSVEDGIEFLRNYDIYVHPRCRHTIDELTCYRWKIDRQTNEILSKLADENNHVIDSLRYAVESLRRNGGDISKARSQGPRIMTDPSKHLRGQSHWNDPSPADLKRMHQERWGTRRGLPWM